MQNSVFCRFFLWLYHAAGQSAVIRAIEVAVGAVGRALRGSIFGRILCRETSIDSYTGTSVLYRGMGVVREGITGFFTRMYGKLRSVNSGSLNMRLYEKTLGGSFLFHLESLLAVFVLLIFILPHKMWNNLYATALTALLTVVYFLCIISGRKDMEERPKGGLWFPLLFFMFAVVLGTIGSPTPGDSIRVLAFFVTAFLLCVVVRGTLSSYAKIDFFLRGIVLALLLTGAYAAVQRVMGVAADASLTDLELNRNMPGRVFGTLGNPNNFAEFLMLFIPFALAFSINQERKGWRVLGIAAVIVGTVALVLTYSRSGWLAFALAAVVFIALYNWRLLPILFLVGVLCIPLLPQTVLNRILTIGNLADSSSSYRVDIWTGSLRMLRDGYWFAGTGLGAGAFTSVYPAYAVGTSGVAPHTHMQFMEMLAELGILGFLSLLWYSISLSRRTAVSAAATVSRKMRNVLCAAAASMAGITAIGFVEYTWFYPRVQLAFFIAAGIAMAAVHIAGKEQKK
ncbi:MAG: O-antigen ligase family protein [Clostridia bacterium]|nr:O-antigen ligase family protein [Clostridia bacterium]